MSCLYFLSISQLKIGVIQVWKINSDHPQDVFRAIILNSFPFKEAIFSCESKECAAQKRIHFFSWIFSSDLDCLCFFFIYFIKFVVLCGKSQILHLKEPFLRKRVLSFFRSFIQKAKVVLFSGSDFLFFHSVINLSVFRFVFTPD